MANLAEQLKAELTERAKNSESCKKYLLDWVMNEFRRGENPVYIIIYNSVEVCMTTDLAARLGFEPEEYNYIRVSFKYENGKHYARYEYKKRDSKQRGSHEWVDITDMDWAQRYCVDGIDESDKILFLRSEGFKVYKTWIYGRGNLLEINY